MNSASRFFPGLALAAALAIGSTSLTAATSIPPEITISLRGVAEDGWEQGEPLVARVRLAAPAGHAEPLELAPATGAWTDALTVELVSAAGGAPVAQAQLLGRPEKPGAVVDDSRVAGGTWVFSAETMQRVAPGDFQVKARLAIPAGRGWNGTAEADALPLRLVAASPDPARLAARAARRAELAAAAGHWEEAARLVDAVLAGSPDDFDLLCLRADLALRGGNPLAARLCVDRAARQFKSTPTEPPPQFFEDVRQRTAAASLPGEVSAPKPPDWTWPPASVTALPAAATVAVPPSPTAAEAPRAAQPKPSPGPTPLVALPSSVATSTPPPPAPLAAPAEVPAGKLVPAAELAESKIRNDPAGQWAATAKAKSSYSNPNYGPAKATGAPDVAAATDSIDAWCPGQQNTGIDWLEVTFASPGRATEVRVRQNQTPGTIIKVEAFEPDGRAHVWWEGHDTNPRPSGNEITWFAVRVPETPYPVARIKLTLNLALVPGWKQIDTVQLVTAP